jgi:hypothetical protein
MATLRFLATEYKAFTPVASALTNLANGPGTVISLTKKTASGASGNTDFTGLRDNGTGFFRGISQQSGPAKLWDDDNSFVTATNASIDSATDWVWNCVDWPGGATGQLQRFHWRNHSTGGTWTNDPSSVVDGGNRAGPTTTNARYRIGYLGDESGTGKDVALVAVWSGTRFADSDYGTWTKTSDLANHARGAPTLLVECNATTLVDLMGGSTYSSANSSGGLLTGSDPPTWTFDGLGAGVSGSSTASGPGVAGEFHPHLNYRMWL